MMASGGRNFWMEKYMADDILTGKLKAAFALGLLHKDVRLARQLGRTPACPCCSAVGSKRADRRHSCRH